jgi:hypothetical protein
MEPNASSHELIGSFLGRPRRRQLDASQVTGQLQKHVGEGQMARRNSLIQRRSRKLTIVRGTTCEIRRIWHPRTHLIVGASLGKKRASAHRNNWSTYNPPQIKGQPLSERGITAASNCFRPDRALVGLTMRPLWPMPRWEGGDDDEEERGEPGKRDDVGRHGARPITG